MSCESNMQRGAREANAESALAAQSKAMGEALGGMAAFIAAINKLTVRVEALEAKVDKLKAALGDGGEG